MEAVLIIIAILLLFAGLLGCVLPAIPGPPLSYVALLLVQWAWKPFETTTLIVFAIITIAVTLLDYIIPVWGAKVFGATKQGIYGSIIGMLVGTFLTPVGMIAGLLIGAILGDVVGGRKLSDAVGSGLGTFIGTMAGMAVKLIVSGVMTFMVFFKIAEWVIAQF
ncbi:MAG: hypothetical protein POELPBGB_00711 [Bacteroidia bacterium]|nr:hypothetical protein [Bacteroidia bacterium]